MIAITGVLFGLLLQATQRVRASVARSQCQNNLRQLGLALHLYHGVRNQFPPGLADNRSADRYPYLSWNARLLPFLDQAPLWAEIQRAFAAEPDFLKVPPHGNQSTIVSAFSCPSDIRVGNPSQFGPAFTSYLGVEGTDQFREDGILYLNSRTRMVEIMDGTSNTLMVGERPGSSDERLGWWYAGWGQSKDGSAEMVLGAREYAVPPNGTGCPRGPYHFTSGRFDNLCDTFHFWSAHRGGANFLFGDGSVRHLSYSVDRLMPALATRAGGDTASID